MRLAFALASLLLLGVAQADPPQRGPVVICDNGDTVECPACPDLSCPEAPACPACPAVSCPAPPPAVLCRSCVTRTVTRAGSVVATRRRCRGCLVQE